MCKTFSICFFVAALLVGAAMSASAATLLARYNFSEGATTTTADSSGNGNTATLSNFVGDPWNTAFDTARYDTGPSALSFTTESLTNRVTAPDAPSLNVGTDSVSISFLVKQVVYSQISSSTLDGWQTRYVCKGTSAIIAGATPPGAAGRRFEVVHKNRQMNVVIDDGDPSGGLYGHKAQAKYNANNTNVYTGEWVHIVAIVDRVAGLFHLYINGQEQTAAEATGPTETLAVGSLDEPTPLCIGNYIIVASEGETADKNRQQSLTGSMDDVRIYRGVLTPLEIQKMYDAPPPAGVEHWELFY